MRLCFQLGLALAATGLFGLTTKGQGTTIKSAPSIPAAGPGGLPAGADKVVVGKIVEIEPGTVEVAPYKGAPKAQKIAFKVAALKIDEGLLGTSGLTRIRVGFPADSSGVGQPSSRFTAPAGPIGPPSMAIPLTAGMEGCFSLARHHDGDFYVLVEPPLQKKDAGYAKELAKIKLTAKAIDDPVAALKAKDLHERFEAARIVLHRYLIPHGSNKREPIPDEENKLIVALLTELPWSPKDGQLFRATGEMVPSRSALWYSINPGEFGFKQPAVPARGPGDPPVDRNKLMDEATTRFLKENGDKIQIKRFVGK